MMNKHCKLSYIKSFGSREYKLNQYILSNSQMVFKDKFNQIYKKKKISKHLARAAVALEVERVVH